MIRTDRLLAGVKACCDLLAPAGTTTVKANERFPNKASDSPVITMKITAGPDTRPASRWTRDEPTVVRWSVEDVVANSRVGLTLAGVRWAVDVDPTWDDEDTRDALLELFDAERVAALLGDVEIEADGTDAITFTAATPGLLWGVRGIGLSVTTENTTTVEADVASSIAVVTVELQGYTSGVDLTASQLLGSIIAGMALDAAVEARDAYGVALHSNDAAVNIPTISGAEWQSRATVRCVFSFVHYTARSIAVIERVTGTLTAFDGNTAITIDVDVDTQE